MVLAHLLKDPWCDLGLHEREWWGEHAPPDLAAMLVMAISDGDRLIAIPLWKQIQNEHQEIKRSLDRI